MAKDKSVPLGLRLLGGNAKVYNTIAEMQQDRKLKAGKVVEVLGYYQAGDGAGHKRKIENEDDGSGVLLENGLYANIVHNGDILLNWFGAKDDITYNSTNEVKRFFGYMKTNPYCNFIIPDGTFAWETNVFIPSNITLTINGKFVAFSSKGIRIESHDGVTSTPAYTGTHDIVITGNGIVDARGNVFPNNVQTPFRIYHSKNVTIENITIKNISTYHAIESGGTDGLFIRNVKFKGEFINTGLQLSDYTLEAIQIEAITPSGASGAIPYDNTPTKNVVIEGCYFGASEEGGEMYGCIGEHSSSSSLIYENIVIKNNTFTGVKAQKTYTKGIISLSSNYKNLSVENNEFKNCAGTSLDHRGNNIYNGVIFNNIIADENKESTQFSMSFVHSENLIIMNNLFSKTRGTSIRMRGVSNNLLIINNLFSDFSLNNDTSQQSGGICIMLYGSGKGVVIKNNTMKSSSNYVSSPIHIPDSSLPNYKNINLDNNAYILNQLKITDYGKYMDRNEDIIYNGGVYYGGIEFSVPINYFNEIDIVYMIGDSILTKRYKITHSNNYGGVQQKDIIIKDFNLGDNNGLINLMEVHLLINADYNSANINLNISNSNGTYNKKIDNTNDGGFIKIAKIIGYNKHNRIMINPIEDIVRSLRTLENKMLIDGVLDSYNSYIEDLDNYEEQQKKVLEDKAKAYELALQSNPNLTYEEFEKTYDNTSMMNRRKKRSLVEKIEEPQIPDSVVKFMEKYLGTTPTPKVETKPRTFSFDEVDKLNDTLKKL